MASDLWLESEFDMFEDQLQPDQQVTALARYRMLRIRGFSSNNARADVLRRWGW